MRQKLTLGGAILAILAIFVLYDSLFIINETETAFVMEFGEFKRTHNTPGLQFKVPMIQNVVKYDRRILDYTLPPQQVTAGDQKRMIIDLFVLYNITDSVLFYRTVQDENGARNRLNSIVPGSLRRVIGRVNMADLLSSKRADIMGTIHKEIRDASKPLGIDVKEVRIIRADLPKENSEAIFNRMISERQREAMLFRAEGDKLANEIMANADRKKAEIMAEAYRAERTKRGEGDAEATRIFARAYGKDKNFFEFYRSLRAYEKSLTPENTTYVLSMDHSFFKHLEHRPGR